MLGNPKINPTKAQINFWGHTRRRTLNFISVYLAQLPNLPSSLQEHLPGHEFVLFLRIEKLIHFSQKLDKG